MKNRYSFSAKVGRIRAAEIDYLWLPDEPYSGYPVIYLHGAGTLTKDASTSAAFWATASLTGTLAFQDIPVMAGWMGGDTMANDLAMTCIENTRLYLDALPGIDASKVHLAGTSMGGGMAIRYAGLNPTKVASVYGMIPYSNPQGVYAEDRGGFRATSAAAWGVTYPTPLPAQADFVNTHAPVIKAANIPVRLLYSTTDVLATPSDVTTLATALNITAEPVDTANGHTEQSIWNFGNMGAGAWTDYIAWIKSHN